MKKRIEIQSYKIQSRNKIVWSYDISIYKNCSCIYPFSKDVNFVYNS